MGWCARDPRRQPLSGLEQRGCWQERPATAIAIAAEAAARAGERTNGQHIDDGEGAQPAAILDFVPVELVGRVVISSMPVPEAGDTAEPEAQRPLPQLVADADESWAERTSLFGELEA